MRQLLWIVASIIILIIAWPVFLFLLVLMIALLLFSPKRVMVFRPQPRPTNHESTSFQSNANVIDVEAEVTIIDDENKS